MTEIKNADGTSTWLNSKETHEKNLDDSYSSSLGVGLVVGSFIWYLIFSTMNATYYLQNTFDRIMYGYFEFMLVNPYNYIVEKIPGNYIIWVMIGGVIGLYLLFRSRHPSFLVKMVRGIAPVFYFLPYIISQGILYFP